MSCTAILFLPLCSLCPALTLLLLPSLVRDPQGCGLAGHPDPCIIPFPFVQGCGDAGSSSQSRASPSSTLLSTSTLGLGTCTPSQVRGASSNLLRSSTTSPSVGSALVVSVGWRVEVDGSALMVGVTPGLGWRAGVDEVWLMTSSGVSLGLSGDFLPSVPQLISLVALLCRLTS